jgi:molecular chaperone HtpG
METLDEYLGKPLVSLGAADVEIDGAEGEKSEEPSEDSPLIARSSRVLEKKVAAVKRSRRLTDSPACLVVPEGGLPAHLERLMRATGRDLPASRRVLELNLGHPLVQRVAELEAREPGSERVQDWILLIYDQALLAEGSPPDDPAEFAKRLSKLMTEAAQSAAGESPRAAPLEPSAE